MLTSGKKRSHLNKIYTAVIKFLDTKTPNNVNARKNKCFLDSLKWNLCQGRFEKA